MNRYEALIVELIHKYPDLEFDLCTTDGVYGWHVRHKSQCKIERNHVIAFFLVGNDRLSVNCYTPLRCYTACYKFDTFDQFKKDADAKCQLVMDHFKGTSKDPPKDRFEELQAWIAKRYPILKCRWEHDNWFVWHEEDKNNCRFFIYKIWNDTQFTISIDKGMCCTQPDGQLKYPHLVDLLESLAPQFDQYVVFFTRKIIDFSALVEEIVAKYPALPFKNISKYENTKNWNYDHMYFGHDEQKYFVQNFDHIEDDYVMARYFNEFVPFRQCVLAECDWYQTFLAQHKKGESVMHSPVEKERINRLGIKIINQVNATVVTQTGMVCPQCLNECDIPNANYCPKCSTPLQPKSPPFTPPAKPNLFPCLNDDGEKALMALDGFYGKERAVLKTCKNCDAHKMIGKYHVCLDYSEYILPESYDLKRCGKWHAEKIYDCPVCKNSFEVEGYVEKYNNEHYAYHHLLEATDKECPICHRYRLVEHIHGRIFKKYSYTWEKDQ